MKLSKGNYMKARDFILTNARMIERRLFQFRFEKDSPEGVFHAVYAYRNADGGFGHGMEPDTASPESQPLFSIMALETLDEVGYLTKDLILNDFMPYFKSITTDKGGIPWMKRPTSDYPCEDHFKTVKEWAALSTTAPLLGMLEKNGICPIASFVSPYKESRDFVRKLTNRFIEVYVATPLDVCEKRDTKGLYKKAKAGEISQFTGIDDPYEAPENPEIVVHTQNESPDVSAQRVLEYLKMEKYLI